MQKLQDEKKNRDGVQNVRYGKIKKCGTALLLREMAWFAGAARGGPMVGDDDEKGERESGGPDAIDKILIDKKFSPAKKKTRLPATMAPMHHLSIHPSTHPLFDWY